MEANDSVHEGSGQDDLIEHRDAATNHASVAPLWTHGQVPLMTVPGAKAR